MKPKTSAEIRQTFLDFFAERGHQIVAASSLVPGNDPTLLFTNAGMVQFKDVFLGLDQRPYTRATTAQKCMRISGKHNDLENVGPSPRHHTFFEMLGNFSFGSYFKRDAIIYAYDLLTRVYGLPPERLAFTVFRSDDEAYNIWTREVGVDPQRVARLGPKTNFWQMADTGPCGPTSEIHWDQYPERGISTIVDSLEREDDRFLELWNLVFMQFNRTRPDPDHSGEFDQPLPATGIDTGMGLERVVSVIQGCETNYDTDLFTDLMDATQEILRHDDEYRQRYFVAYRVIADHIRSAAFLIADGVNPGTTGREYVPRMLLRRALRFAHGMGVTQPFLADVAMSVISKLGPVYPELIQFREAIRYQISTEEERFSRMLAGSLAVLENEIAAMRQAGQAQMPGDAAFDLYQTHGLPLELSRDVLKEQGMTVDEKGFQEALAEHRERSGGETAGFEDVSLYQDVLNRLRTEGALPQNGVVYNPYEYERMGKFQSTVLALVSEGRPVSEAAAGAPVEVVLSETAFYVESGGQVSDTGTLSSASSLCEITGMATPIGGLIIHIGKVAEGVLRTGDRVTGAVNTSRRWDIMRNHTATHLLHAALRSVLGEHVRQKGSLVAPDRLRFDFTHNASITEDEIARIEDQVNEMILANESLSIVFKSLEEARRDGAMALFGEKYGETVRTISIHAPGDHKQRWSYELCGGTHVRSTAEIGSFVITREESSSAGVRRIEAVTGRGAWALIHDRLVTLETIAELLGADVESASARAQTLIAEFREAQHRLEQFRREAALMTVDTLVQEAVEVAGSQVIAAQVDASDTDLLSQMADWCRDRLDSGVVLLGSAIEGKVRLVAKVTPDLVKRGVHAGQLVGSIAKQVGGGGGGRPDFATAGGKDVARLPDAVRSTIKMVEDALK